MNKKKENILVPELRFPEFRDAELWRETILIEVAEYENGKAHEQDIDVNGKFIVVNSKFISTDGRVKKYTNTAFCLSKKDDILMVLSDVPNGRAIAKCFCVDKDDYYTVNQRICKISPTKVVGKLLFYLLNRNPYFLGFDDGVKQTNLKNEDVINCLLLLPNELEEQQKIAACLSSLDELITAHTQKLALLKDHKKGLMQSLFPADGESVPRLRFKEFSASNKWEEKRLNQVCDVNPSSNQLPALFVYVDLESVEKGILLKKKIISLEGAPSRAQRLLKNKDIIFQIVRPYQKNNFYFQTDEEIDYVASTGYAQLRAYESSMFLFQYLHIPVFVDKVLTKCTGSNYPSINSSDLQGIKIVIPQLKEQQKIAECLSSLDQIIQGQAQKIEQLKLHKKGLMQGLFPAATN